MGTLSKEEVARLINEEAETRKKKGEQETAGGLGGAILKRVGGMLSSSRKKGGRANRDDYMRYVEDEQSNGRRAKTFAEWSESDE